MSDKILKFSEIKEVRMGNVVKQLSYDFAELSIRLYKKDSKT